MCRSQEAMGDLRYGHTDVCMAYLGGEAGLGFLWFVWAFEGFVLFFCILHLIGASASLLSRQLLAQLSRIYILKRAGAATSPLLTGQPAVQRSARVSAWLMQPPHPCLRLSPC